MSLHFGQLIRKNADKLGISASEIAEKTRKHRQTVYADFKKENLNTDVIDQYCTALGISFHKLVGIETVSSDLEDKLKACETQLSFSQQLLQTKDDLIQSLKAQLAMSNQQGSSSQTA